MSELLDELKRSKVVVKGSGPIDADIILIGQAPAKNEVFKGRPFVGEAGDILTMCCNYAMMDREHVRIINLSEVRPPKNDKYSSFSQEERNAWEQDLIRRINEEHIGPKVLVPLGNDAMEAVSGRRGITNQRGVPSEARKEIKHKCFVVPTFHPASISYQDPRGFKKWLQITFDLIKAQRIADTFDTFEIPEFKFIVRPTFQVVMEHLDFLEREKPFIALDVENPHLLLSAIGIAWSKYEAICIPFYMGNGDNYWSLEEEIAIWKRLAEVLPQLEWGNQHVHFDWRVMVEHGVFMSVPTWDSMLMHHCLYSEMPHTLDMITSIYTDLPFYKRDETEEKGSVLRAGKEHDHWVYNCYDCVGAYWAMEHEKQDLLDEGMMQPYMELYVAILEPVFKMIMKGVPVNVPSLAEVQKELRISIQKKVSAITEATGQVVFVLPPEENTDKEKKRRRAEGELNLQSWQDVSKLLYEVLKWGKYKRGSPTGKETLQKLAYREESDIPLMLIDIKAERKEIGLFSEENITDGRVKTEYNISTNTGRFASKKGRRKTGMNLQNVKHGGQRRFFIPEPGEVMLCADQKQAEARIVAMYADDEAMLAICASDESIHIANAKQVFDEEDFDKEDPRYRIAKALIHGANYGLGAMQFAHIAKIRQSEAKEHLIRYHATYPGIRDKFHKEVKNQILKDRTLYNPFGRREMFLGSMQDYRVFNAGYAFKPQSTSTDVNKKANASASKHFTIMMDTHDGLIMSLPESEIANGIEVFLEAYNTEIKIGDHKMVIPIDITVGDNWEDQEEVILT